MRFLVEGCQTDSIAVIRDEICTVMYSKHMSCNVGFEGTWGNIFFKSVRVYLETVGIGRSVCLYLLVWGEVGVLCLREAFGQAG